MKVATGKTSILKLCKDHGFAIEIADNNLLLLQGELIDPRYDVLLLQSGEDYVEFDVISKEEYTANYNVI